MIDSRSKIGGIKPSFLMKKKYENLIVGLIALGMFAIILSIPSILTLLPVWVVGLIGLSFIFLWLFVGVGGFANYFIDIYKSDGFYGLKKEIIYWLPSLYFLGCVILAFQKGFFVVGIIGCLIGVLYFCIKSFIETKRLDSFALIYIPPLAIGGLFLFVKILSLLNKIPYFVPIALGGFVVWVIFATLIAFKQNK